MPRAILYDFITGERIPLNTARCHVAEGWNGAYGLGTLLHPDADAEALLKEHQRVLETRAGEREKEKRAGQAK